jgi:hypothetical protein
MVGPKKYPKIALIIEAEVVYLFKVPIWESTLVHDHDNREKQA